MVVASLLTWRQRPHRRLAASVPWNRALATITPVPRALVSTPRVPERRPPRVLRRARAATVPPPAAGPGRADGALACLAVGSTGMQLGFIEPHLRRYGGI